MSRSWRSCSVSRSSLREEPSIPGLLHGEAHPLVDEPFLKLKIPTWVPKGLLVGWFRVWGPPQPLCSGPPPPCLCPVDHDSGTKDCATGDPQLLAPSQLMGAERAHRKAGLRGCSWLHSLPRLTSRRLLGHPVTLIRSQGPRPGHVHISYPGRRLRFRAGHRP